jgi:hypothetical protein
MRSKPVRVLAAIVLSSVAAISAACGSSTSSTTPVTDKPAARLLAAAQAAALAKGSMHWIEDVKVGSGTTQRFVSDAGTTQGKQIITGTNGTGTILLVPAQMLYARGDATFLEHIVQLSQHEATKYAGQWIAVPSSNSAYSGLALGLTVATLVPRQSPTAPLRFLKPTTIDGKSVVGVSGGFDTSEAETGWAGTQVLYISTATPHLPVAMTQHGTVSGGGSITDAAHMSGYGEPVVMAAPARSIPISSILNTP